MEGFNGGPSDIYNYSRNNNIFGDANNSNSAGYIREQELDKYRYIHPYMFDIGYDKTKNEMTLVYILYKEKYKKERKVYFYGN